MHWLSSRSVAIVWLLAALSLIGWLIVNLDVAGWIILVVTVGLMAFELPRGGDGPGRRPKGGLPDKPTGYPRFRRGPRAAVRSAAAAPRAGAARRASR